jgi:gliding motility-associated-like protein
MALITKVRFRVLYFTNLLFFTIPIYAQDPIEVVNTYTNEQLVNALVDNECAVISNISINGSNGAANRSYGYFTSGPDFPFSSGIILSTGFVMGAPGPNDTILSDGVDSPWQGDADLEEVLGINNTLNATTMEFDFVPTAGHISFDYIFASEEYRSWPNPDYCDFSDGFAFLLREAGSSGPYQNLAVIPDTNTPVQVTTVRGAGVSCPSANTQYFDSFNGVDSPTNFNGQTVVLTAEANVIPGTLYHIKLVIADQGDAQYDAAVFLKGNSFSTTVTLGDDRLISEGSALCEGNSLGLNALTPNATGYQWYKNDEAIPGAINAGYTVTSAGDYSVEARLTPTCFARGRITVEYNAAVPTDPIAYFQCDDNGDGLTAYYPARMQVEITQNMPGLVVQDIYRTLEDAQANTNALNIVSEAPFYNTIPDQQVFARITNEAGCIGIVPVILSTPPAFTNTLPVYEVCDTDGTDDGVFSFSLADFFYNNQSAGIPAGITLDFYTTYDEAIAYTLNNLPYQFTNTIPGGQSVFASVSTDRGCFAIIELKLVVHSFGSDDVVNAMLCEGETITLDAGSYTSYSWDTDPVQTTRTITVDEPGAYTVTVTNSFDCEGSKTFTVLPSGRATGTGFDIKEFTGNDNSITVLPTGIGTYEYSINGDDWQQSPVFSHLPAGEYTIYIKDINGCGPVYTESIFVLDYPVFFTPNGDGVNDIWRIPYSRNRPEVFITVFDRYGKVITGFNSHEQGWDGTYNGKPLPATDYWFVIDMENGKNAKGHFSMLR